MTTEDKNAFIFKKYIRVELSHFLHKHLKNKLFEKPGRVHAVTVKFSIVPL